MLIHEFEVNMAPGETPTELWMNQYDEDFQWQITPYWQDEAFKFPAGTTVAVRGTKPDGNGYSMNASLDSSEDKVFITVYGDKQITAASGRAVFELVFLNGGKQLCTANFFVHVERAALDKDTVVSTSKIREIMDVSDQLEDTLAAVDKIRQTVDDAKTLVIGLDEIITEGIAEEEQLKVAVEKAKEVNAEALLTIAKDVDDDRIKAEEARTAAEQAKIATEQFINENKNFKLMKSQNIRYGVSNSFAAQPSSWSMQISVVEKGKVLWTKIDQILSNNEHQIFVIPTYQGQDATMEQVIKSVKYQNSSLTSEIPSGTWLDTIPSESDTEHLWTKVEYMDGKVSYFISKTPRKIYKVYMYFYLSSSETNLSGGTWSANMPEYEEGKFLWFRPAVQYKGSGESSYGEATYHKVLTQSCANSLAAKKKLEAIQPFVEDSSWIEVATTSKFKTFGDRPYDIPKYRKIGKAVEIRGKVQPTEVLAGSADEVIIFTLPEGFRPPVSIHFICQGSGKNTWLCTVQRTGNVTFARYGTTSMIECPTSAWLVIQGSFYID